MSKWLALWSTLVQANKLLLLPHPLALPITSAPHSDTKEGLAGTSAIPRKLRPRDPKSPIPDLPARPCHLC